MAIPLAHLLEQLSPYQAQLIAVSKTHSAERIRNFYNQGQLDFGENRVSEMCEKQEKLPQDIRWHMIGHLQTNKVKYIAPFVHLIHSIDSLRLLNEVNKQARRNDRVIDCLLQFHIAEEDSKYGLSEDEARNLLLSDDYQKMTHVRLIGVMGMATFTNNRDQVRREFDQLKHIFECINGDFFQEEEHFTEISMGMSGDYEMALEAGSTMVRVGSLLFGDRN